MARIAAPAPLKLIAGRSEGRDSGGRVVPTPPAFRRIPPKPPTWLSREAKAEWRRVAPGLTRLNLLKEEDRATFTLYCETWARWVDANRSVARDGFSIETETGTTKRNPALTALETATNQLRVLAREFGLTPSSEAGLSRESAESGDDDTNPF